MQFFLLVIFLQYKLHTIIREAAMTTKIILWEAKECNYPMALLIKRRLKLPALNISTTLYENTNYKYLTRIRHILDGMMWLSFK